MFHSAGEEYKQFVGTEGVLLAHGATLFCFLVMQHTVTAWCSSAFCLRLACEKKAADADEGGYCLIDRNSASAAVGDINGVYAQAMELLTLLTTTKNMRAYHYIIG